MQTSTGNNTTGKVVGPWPRSRWLLVGVGLGVGVLGLTAQILLRRSPPFSQMWSRLNARAYYRGGFQMTLREASQILGTSISSPPARIREAHRRVILANHPDRGGSPYLASKINAAKELMLQFRKKKDG
ncbi:mitochondrial import inner membrane translocase subunit TIM14 isoform X2 [Drosophila kikkawai]|uniref:Mitochondrial import inner membrane translocase subunit TIM14 isoform X2 n=1 Tax=Drosophila kikkawai TaxID=30033 RepID=A0A6P4IG54_DROKI|nr:mitochondrial import inner membrane translocase subunit TIM14 isoform X2 [Drosophila kikkawai]